MYYNSFLFYNVDKYMITLFRIQVGAAGLMLKLLAIPKGLWEDTFLNMACKTHLLIKHSEFYYIIFYFTLLLLLRRYEIPEVTFACARFSRKFWRESRVTWQYPAQVKARKLEHAVISPRMSLWGLCIGQFLLQKRNTDNYYIFVLSE